MEKLLLKACALTNSQQKDILIDGDKIVAIEDNIELNTHSISCSNHVLFPGIIDVHAHIRDMGLSQKEDWLSASKAAAAGGITTIFDMPNTKPATFDSQSLAVKRESARKSVVNYGYNFGVTEYNAEEIRKASPIASLKMFMAESSSGYVVEKENTVKEVFQLANEIAKPVIVHSELQSCVEKYEKKFDSTLANHNKIRNRVCAINATKRVLKLAKETGAHVYLAHISTAEEIALIRAAKNNGLSNIFCETTPHYIFIDESILDRAGNFGKVNPPLRTAQDRKAIIEGIKDGTVDTIGSDHAPHTLSEKGLDYTKAPSGFPGLETSLGLLLKLVHSGYITLQKLAQLMAENPAAIFNIKDRGKLKVGNIADLTLIDINYNWKVEPEKFFSKAKYSPFRGMELKGKAITTIVNGNIIWHNNEINDIKGQEVEFA